jgi:hypothetical protein
MIKQKRKRKKKGKKKKGKAYNAARTSLYNPFFSMHILWPVGSH